MASEQRSALYVEVRTEFFEGRNMHRAGLIRAGQALIKADALTHKEYEALEKELYNEGNSPAFLAAAKKFAAGELDIKLAELGSLTDALKCKLTKKTQQRLVNEKLRILIKEHDDGEDEVIEKSIFEMTLAEVKQVLDDEGTILRPDQQKVGGKRKLGPREPRIRKPKAVSFLDGKLTLTLKNGDHDVVHVDQLRDGLLRRGELEKLVKALNHKGKAIFDPDKPDEDVA